MLSTLSQHLPIAAKIMTYISVESGFEFTCTAKLIKEKVEAIMSKEYIEAINLVRNKVGAARSLHACMFTKEYARQKLESSAFCLLNAETQTFICLQLSYIEHVDSTFPTPDLRWTVVANYLTHVSFSQRCLVLKAIIKTEDETVPIFTALHRFTNREEIEHLLNYFDDDMLLKILTDYFMAFRNGEIVSLDAFYLLLPCETTGRLIYHLHKLNPLLAVSMIQWMNETYLTDLLNELEEKLENNFSNFIYLLVGNILSRQ